MKVKKIWVVEMWAKADWGGKPHWVPTVGVGLSRAEARSKRSSWQRNNPYDQFRVRPYFA